jgi:hypothetical protein
VIAAKRTNGQLQALDESVLEKYGYIITLLLKYPKFYAAMHHDYYNNGSKSGWSLTKVL